MSTKSKFLIQLTSLLNKHSKENQSNTPDYILANYLSSCLNAFNKATNARDSYYNENKNKELVVHNNPIQEFVLGRNPIIEKLGEEPKPYIEFKDVWAKHSDDILDSLHDPMDGLKIKF